MITKKQSVILGIGMFAIASFFTGCTASGSGVGAVGDTQSATEESAAEDEMIVSSVTGAVTEGTRVAVDSQSESPASIPQVVTYRARYDTTYVPTTHVSEWGSYPNIDGGFSVWVRGYYDENREWVQVEYNEAAIVKGIEYMGQEVPVYDGMRMRYVFNGTPVELNEIIFRTMSFPTYSSAQDARSHSTKGGSQDDFGTWCAAEDYEYTMEACNAFARCFNQCETDIANQIAAGTP